MLYTSLSPTFFITFKNTTFKNNILRHNWPQGSSLKGNTLEGISSNNDGKKILLLQGPVGPFFKTLKSFLEAKGLNVHRAVFHAGDYVYSNSKNRIVSFDGEVAWRNWLIEKLSSDQFDVIVYYGSERKAHKIAQEVGEQYGVRLLSLEEGYIRTGFITLEEGGNNANSPLFGKVHDDGFEPVLEHGDSVENRNSMPLITFYGMVYFRIRGWFATASQKELFHREVSLLKQTYFWVRNLYRKKRYANLNKVKVAGLLKQYKGQYFLVPLQVATDVTLKKSALGWDNKQLIREAIISFSKHAPKNSKLVFKIHPMERGHSDNSPFIKKLAKSHNVEKQVEVICDGSLADLTKNSAGMITINSSSGLSAIFHGTPLLVLGKAIYNHPSLVTNMQKIEDLNVFWKSNFVAKPAFRLAYIAWLKENTLTPIFKS